MKPYIQLQKSGLLQDLYRDKITKRSLLGHMIKDLVVLNTFSLAEPLRNQARSVLDHTTFRVVIFTEHPLGFQEFFVSGKESRLPHIHLLDDE